MDEGGKDDNLNCVDWMYQDDPNGAIEFQELTLDVSKIPGSTKDFKACCSGRLDYGFKARCSTFLKEGFNTRCRLEEGHRGSLLGSADDRLQTHSA
jgi:hypothetical protein